MKKISVLVLFICSGLLLAGYLEPAFEEYVQSLPNNAEVRAIVTMADQVDVGTLDAELTARNADLQERHFVVTSQLMNKCSQSQKDILAYLSRERQKGDIRSFRSFWLSNSIALVCKKSTLMEITNRPDVDIVYRDLPVELIKPVSREPAPPSSKAYEWGLAMCRADSLWRKGITGLGRLAFLIETGVYLQHPCVLSRWRGRNGGLLRHAWFDALGTRPNPVDPNGHGTHICGTILGGSPGDTVGMAFGGQWIATNALDQGVGAAFDAAIRDAYNWAADPDSNPATVYDVPDVCSNAWGIDARFSGYQDCDRRWNREIFNLEAAGCMNVFAAGSEGPARQTHRSPANICTTYTLNYAVVAVDNQGNIASFSSRGPTDCTTYYPSIYWCKPEVSAPGVNIRSCVNTGGYGTMSGVSMAQAHPVGALLLLRQYNTNITPDSAKKILMYTAVDRGTAGEDSVYGWGIINCAEALRSMPRSPSLAYLSYRIIDSISNGNRNGLPDPGERVEMVDTIWSAGGRKATSITGILRVRPGFNYVVIEDSTATFGDLDSLEGPNRKGHNNADRFQFRVLASIPDADSVLPFVLALRSNSGTYRVENIYAVWRGYTPVKITDEKREEAPSALNLHIISPARRSIRITYALPHSGYTTLKIYNAAGLLVSTLVDRNEEAGVKNLALDGKKLAAGIYFANLVAEDKNIIKKLILVR